MKTKSLTSLAVLTCSAIALAVSNDADVAAKQLQIYPKNLARQHVGSNLFLFNPANSTYAPTEAAAAWLDDDVATGWPVMAGKQHYLLSLSEAQLITNFSVYARPATGTVTLSASDEPAPPTSKAWTVVARDIPLESINQKKLAKPFSRFAKYVLIETDIADPGPLFSLYLYSEKPAVSYDLRKRDQPIDTRAIFGPFVNEQTSISVSALYSGSRVVHANATDGYVGWQKAIDDNPESSLTLAPSTNQAGAVIKFSSTRAPRRLSVLTDSGARGKLDFFIVDSVGTEKSVPASGAPGFVPVNNPLGRSSAPTAGEAVSLDGLTPTVSMVLDGTSAHSNLDIPSVSGSALLVRWTPANGIDNVSIREFNAFADVTLTNYELSPSPDAIAELSQDRSKDGKAFKDFKQLPEEVGQLLPQKSPYLPGSLGFPPNITGRTGRSNPVSP